MKALFIIIMIFLSGCAFNIDVRCIKGLYTLKIFSLRQMSFIETKLLDSNKKPIKCGGENEKDDPVIPFIY